MRMKIQSLALIAVAGWMWASPAFAAKRTSAQSGQTVSCWDQIETVNRPFASTLNQLTATWLAKGFRTVRTEELGGPICPRKLCKFADGRGGTVYLLIWRSGVGQTSYALKKEHQ